MKIMFICTGNTCRSAIAEAMLKKMAQENNKKVEVFSSGIFTNGGEMASPNAIEVMKKYNIDLTSHRSTNIKDAHLEDMDVILCAMQGHKERIIRLYPNLKEKIYTIREYADLAKEKGPDINDPWGLEIENYNRCVKEIEECLQVIIKKL